jgi:asparagine synthase (glutamine-hydrolysing)
MCGILGIIGQNNTISKDEFYNFLQKSKHRGPDLSKIWFSKDNIVKLGHNRLSIIDLSEKGNQPFFDDENKLAIIFNGEIYNFLDLKKKLSIEYTFKSLSDTEVILKAYAKWGFDCVDRFNGMFAFAIYDIKKSLIFCSRDRAGQKPFFYNLENNNFIFTSELKNFIPNFKTPSIKVSSLNEYFKFGFIAGENTIFQNFNKLPPAHNLIYSIKNNNIKIYKYWEPTVNNNKINKNLDYNIDEFIDIFDNAIQRHLISDVPLGVLLSGGIDSSLVTAFASKHRPNIKTFTVTFPEFEKYNESDHAKLVSEYFSTHHIEIEANTVDPQKLLPKLAAQYDEPIIDSSIIPTFLVCQEVSKNCKVALGGDGGDELFGGYHHYQRLLISKYIKFFLPQAFWTFLSKFTTFLPLGFKGKIWLESLKYNLSKDLPIIASYFDDFERKKLLNENFYSNNDNNKKDKIYFSKNLKERSMWTDFLNYLPEDILVKLDRSSMLNSLEIRAPFLDNEVIKFSEKLDNKFKFSINNKKIFLKKLSSKILPKQLNLSRKQGFAIPLDLWIRKDKKWLEYINLIFFDNNQKIFNTTYLQKLINDHANGINLGERIFSVLMFILWSDKYKKN